MTHPETPPAVVELLPCPGCGFRGLIDDDSCENFPSVSYGVLCGNPDCCFQIGCNYTTEKYAADAWNTRTPGTQASPQNVGELTERKIYDAKCAYTDVTGQYPSHIGIKKAIEAALAQQPAPVREKVTTLMDRRAAEKIIDQQARIERLEQDLRDAHALLSQSSERQ